MLEDAGLGIKERVIRYKPRDNSPDAPLSQYVQYNIEPNGREPKFEEILVRDTSRFARNLGLLDNVLEELSRMDVYVNFIDIGKTTRNEGDLSFIRFFQIMDEQFVRDLSRKVRQGNERSIANRTMRGNGKTYGLTYIKRKNLQENNQHRLIPHEAKVVRIIYRLYAGCLTPDISPEGFIGCDFNCSTCTIQRTAGIGTRQIANYLTTNKIKTRAKKDFNKRSVDNILQNEKYAGYLNTGKYDTGVIFKDKTYPRVKDEYLIEPDPENIEPTISMELFEICKVNRLGRSDENQSRGRAPSKSLYGGGFLRCAKCGSNYISNKDRGKIFYLCGLKKSKGLKYCTSANVFETTLDTYLERYAAGELSLMHHLYRQSLIIDGLNALHRRLGFIRRNRDDVKVQELQDELDELNGLLKGLYRDRSLNKVDLGVLAELINETEDSLNATRTELEKYTKKPQQYIAEAEKLISELEPILSEHSEHEMNINRTYTVEEVRTHLSHITIYGETNPTGGGGKQAEVKLVPAIYFEAPIQNFLSEEQDLKTYKPLKMKADVGVRTYSNTGEKLDAIALLKYEDDELKSMTEDVQLFSHELLKEQFQVLSETLDTLKSLYY